MSQRRDIDYPFHVDGLGRVAIAGSGDDHVRDLIEQVLFTNPGERVNRPDFGCGVKALLFMPNSDALAAATEVMVKGALQKWLEREIAVEKVMVRAEDARLTITVAYVVRADGLRRVDAFAAPA